MIKMCEPLSPPETGHDWFKDVIDFLGCREVAKIWGKSEPQVYRWARDPSAHLRGIENDATPSPLLRLKITIQELVRSDNKRALQLAMAGIKILEDSLPKTQITPDKPTLLEELCDTYPAVVAFHEAIRHGEHPAATGELCSMAKLDLDEDQVKYLEEIRGKGRGRASDGSRVQRYRQKNQGVS